MAKQNGESDKVKIVVYRLEGSQRVYSNYVEVSSNPVDVSLKFCDLKPASKEDYDKAKKEEKIQIPVITEIVLPSSVAKALLKVLEKQLEKVG